MNTLHYKLKGLLRDYSMEDILEICDLDPVEALELLITYGALDLTNIKEAEGVDQNPID